MGDAVVQRWKFWYPNRWIVALYVLLVVLGLTMTILAWSTDDILLSRIGWPALTVLYVSQFSLLFLQRQEVTASVAGLVARSGRRTTHVRWDEIAAVGSEGGRSSPKLFLQLHDAAVVKLPSNFPREQLEAWRAEFASGAAPGPGPE